MRRRRFIQYAFKGIAATTLLLNDLLANSTARTISSPELLSLVDGKQEVLQVGKEYLKLFPREDYNELISTFTTQSSSTWIRLIQQDYEKGRILTLSGWVLSLTEARHCALFSILNKV